MSTQKIKIKGKTILEILACFFSVLLYKTSKTFWTPDKIQISRCNEGSYKILVSYRAVNPLIGI